jgi:UDPglucose--hexose-1-phosphate uridylyltransferase
VVGWLAQSRVVGVKFLCYQKCVAATKLVFDIVTAPTRVKLADGRDLLFFVLPGHRPAPVEDRRPLPQLDPDQSQLRFDRSTGQWVIVAALRQDRTYKPPPDQCPLCPGPTGLTSEVPAPDYDVVVFENRFPSLSGAGETTPARAGDGFVSAPAFGRCEVICFSSDHTGSFAELEPVHARLVVEAWRHRTADLIAAPGIEQVFCFENRGEEIGVTLHHPHGQIYGFPFVTPRTARSLSQAQAYAAAGRGNLFDDIVAGEVAAGSRIVSRNEHWTAFVPAAARWPYELLLFPAHRVPSLPDLGEAAREAFCDIYLDLLRRFDALFGLPLPYIAAWHQAPVSDQFARREFGLHLQLMSIRRAPGKLKYLAGTESGMGVWINDILPEEAAHSLREAR